MSTPPSETQGMAVRRAYLALEQLQSRLTQVERARTEPIAMVGMACRFPGGAGDPAAFWRLLCDGVDAVSEVPADRWDVSQYYDPDPAVPGRTATRSGAFLEDVDRFDAAFFGIAPREAAALDPQQRLLLEVAWAALEHAGLPADRLMGSKTGVFVGIASRDYSQLQLKTGDLARLDAYFASGSAHSMAAGRLSYVLGLQGPSMAIDTACSSSLVAVHLACQSLRAGECRTALAGGVHLTLSPEATIAFSRARMLAPDGRCKTFAASADGFSEGEGCGIVVLKRLSDAVADGDPIVAVVRGSAINQDGASAGLTAPNGPAQQSVLREALERAGVAPADVTYVEAHGTGTSLGDPIEVQALGAVLGQGRAREAPLLIGSVKTNVGHLEAAAGVAGLIKAALAVQHGEIPGQLHFDTPNPHIPWAQLPVEVVTGRRPWPAGRPRIAGVSAFGFSGTNVHVVLEAAPVAETTTGAAAERPAQVLTLSAKSESALRALAGRWAGALQERSDRALADLAHTANTGRAQLPHRLAIVVDTTPRAIALLRAGAAAEPVPGLALGRALAGDAPRVAFLFTGQGAQQAGMGRELFEGEPVFRGAVERVAAAVAGEMERPLLDVLYGGAGATIDETANTQPALFALEWGLAELWRAWGVEPALVLGHSIGEYVAACVAGVLDVEDAARLVAVRGRLMQALPRGGAMAAVFADEGRVREALRGRETEVGIAAVNGPANVVVSGTAAAVTAVVTALQARGVKSEALRVSHAFHSPLMEPMLEAFGRAAAAVTYAPPRLPIVSNLTGEIARGGEQGQAAYWVRHVREAVRFAAGMAAAERAGVRAYLELGPHPVLAGLGAACVSGAGWIASLRRGRGDYATVLDAVARLWVSGVAIDWAGFAHPRGPARLAGLPTYPFERQRYWLAPAAPAREGMSPSGGHPLLGARVRSPLAIAQFEAELSAQAPPFLAEHRVDETVVLPATAYVEMARAAATALGHARHDLVDVTIAEALTIPEGGCTVQVVVDPERDGSRELRICALDDPRGAGPDTAWRVHATARLAAPAPPPPGVALDEVRARCATTLTREAFYARIDGHGVDLGPSFRGVQRVWRRDGEALGEIQLPAAAGPDAPAYTIHPVLLDACVQVIAAALPPDDATLYLPMALDRWQASAPPPAGVWSLVTVRAGEGGETLVADVCVVDDAGRPIGTMQGLRLKRVERQTLARAAARRLGERLYEIAWRPVPLPAATVETTPAVVSVAEAVGGVMRELPRWRRDEGLARYDAAWPRLERLCTAWIAEALGALGTDLREGVTLAADRLPVAPARRRLLARLVEILVEDGTLTPVAEGWRVVRARPRDESAREERALTADGDAVSAELAFVRRCGPRLADVLRGTADPLALLFPDGSLGDAEALYHHSPPARAYGALAAAAVREIVAGLPAGRRLRVLEIGGGTGGTTAALLPVLPPARTDYLFTDVSPLFAARAAERFADCAFLRTGALDIDADPLAQGLEPGRVDLIVAANVLHATTDLKSTLERCRVLLAPGGVLLLLEVTEPQHWIDVTFGLTDGWWKFADEALRTGYPLLSAPAWRALLEGVGFEHVVVLPEASAVDGVLTRQAMLLAHAPVAAVAPGLETRLIFADAAGVGERLARRLRERGERCLLVRRGDHYEVGAETATIDPAMPVHVERLVRETLGDGGGVAMHLGPLDVDADPQAAVSAGAPLRACAEVLDLARALAAASGRPPRLWIVTRRAQPVGPVPDLAAGQAPVWGLARTIALEHPELGCVCVDLDDGGDDDVAALAAELTAAEGETQVAFRASGRHVARLVRRAAPEVVGSAAEAAERPFRLGRPASGSLDDLALEPLVRRAPGAGEVEIRVRATGLNFKDVLNALGMYPGDAGPLGSECAGVVVGVGPGVRDLRPGQAVIALGAGSFASHVVAPADLVLVKPAALGFEEAAALPIAFITAAHALSDVGRMRAGERVLVHAAAGGVGLAAVRLAQRQGLEVFATAGSAAKRDVLRAQGVAHVFDSRTLDFADEILARTGGLGVDLVLNSLSGESIARSVATLAKDGRFLEIGKRGVWTPAEMARVRPDVTYTIIDWGEVARTDPALIRARFAEVLDAVEAGALAPLPLAVFPLADARAAFRHMAQARHIGKIAVTQPGEAVPPAVRGDGTYLITGGLGGLGLAVAGWLVERGARSLVLLGRRAPSPAAEQAMTALRAAGSDVVAVQADVARAADVARVLADIEHTRAPLRGVFHAAGALDDAVLAQQDEGRLARVMAAKVDGTAHLDRLTRPAPLDFFVLFSSVASILGASGQANHAAANAFLDALAHRRRAAGLPALSVNWGAWSEVGAAVGERVSRRIARQGLSAMAPAEALRALERLLDEGATQAAVLAVDWASLLAGASAGRRPALLAELASTLTAATPAAAGPRLIDQLRSAPAARRAGLLIEHVTQRTARVLGLESAQGIDPLRPLKELGIDSLMAVELRNLLQADLVLDTALPATLVFDHPTVEALAHVLERQVFGATAAAPPEPTPAEGALDRIEQLSDDEVERLLSQRLGSA